MSESRRSAEASLRRGMSAAGLPTFRTGTDVHSKHIALTFAGLYPGELTHSMICEKINEISRRTRDGNEVIEFVIGLELHPDPTIPGRDAHFHAYIHWQRRLKIIGRTTAAIFDILGTRGEWKHPEIVQVGSDVGDRHRWVQYCLKDENAWVSLVATPDPRYPKVTKNTWATMVLEQAETPEQAMAILRTYAPALYFQYTAQFRKNFDMHFGCAQKVQFPLSSFRHGRLPLLGAVVVVLWGESGFGKTQYALAQFRRPS